jgi:hypothetical protein
MPIDEYVNFIDLFKEHEAFKIMRFKISEEVFGKFLFDLSCTWCEFLDVELFVYFLYGILMQISCFCP